jgi:UDP-3-O-[3-hydroxymyristoyl] glucosamine N-acyltransferase
MPLAEATTAGEAIMIGGEMVTRDEMMIGEETTATATALLHVLGTITQDLHPVIPDIVMTTTSRGGGLEKGRLKEIHGTNDDEWIEL